MIRRFSLPALGALVALLLLVPASSSAQTFSEPYDDRAFEKPAYEKDRKRPHRRGDRMSPSVRRPRSAFLGYVQDRFLDFRDLFRLKIGFGGFGAAARVTTLVQVGAVYTNGWYFGMERRAIGAWREQRFAGGIGPLYETDIMTTYWGGNEFADPTSEWNALFPDRGYIRNDVYWDDGRWRHVSIAAEAHVGIVGVDVAVYPCELLDFFLGFAMIDIFHDDYTTLEEEMELQGIPLDGEPPKYEN